MERLQEGFIEKWEMKFHIGDRLRLRDIRSGARGQNTPSAHRRCLNIPNDVNFLPFFLRTLHAVIALASALSLKSTAN